ncbi:15-cis-phytoene synthase [Tabrizicola sp.]|uniref:15-cis-phytoene synthase n=1 Tax=Tabrizicola sp. TaxID=2005166 RepID=UPI0025D0D64E|nr:phytoene/squalene synthase family protein [Tabrizicola sp.]MBY0350297.1 phytoene/squalene synthase family protein [Tabrizicola sp.]MDK2773568.1 phytoene/squalene synthase family protein [Tabrizicola sp.]
MIAPDDLTACKAMIRTGSLSFHAASRLLPARVRDPALALYAFCRVADDDVDEVQDKTAAVLRLRERLDLIYAGRPEARPSDRAFAAVIAGFDLPRALPDALLEGLAWDAMGRRYRTLADLYAYGARVASAVGVMMCVLMRVRDPDALARAADLGLAMQLTNIARDVGEDARAGRLFLPLDWLEEAGIDAGALLADPRHSPALGRVTARLLAAADELYLRSGAGVFSLPPDCRMGIAAARHIYAAIGSEVARQGHDSVTRRARTSRGQKLVLMGRALAGSALTHVLPRPAQLHARPVPEVAFLIEAAGQRSARPQRSETLLAILAQLEARDRRGAAG